MTASTSTEAPARELHILKVDGANGECITLQLDNEDHTLGNSLRYMICKNRNVKFCAYSLPHPNEKRIIFQLQMYPGRGPAIDAFTKGLSDLKKYCAAIRQKFVEETGVPEEPRPNQKHQRNCPKDHLPIETLE